MRNKNQKMVKNIQLKRNMKDRKKKSTAKNNIEMQTDRASRLNVSNWACILCMARMVSVKSKSMLNVCSRSA